jgi:hypothetical protein
MKFNMSKDGTGTIIFEGTLTNFGVPVFCDGQQVDFIVGTVNYHVVYSFNKWVQHGANERYAGNDFHSTWTTSGEVFKFMEKDHAMHVTFVEGDPIPYGTDIFHFNLIGDKGHNYVATCTWDIHSQTFTGVIRSVCTGNNK